MPKQIRALLVDPFDDEREMYELVLTRSGCDVQTITDPDGACLSAAQDVPDVTIIRLRLASDFVTLDAVARLKRDPATCHVPVVMVSSSILESDEEAAKAAGCDAYLQIPCMPSSLADVVRGLTGTAGAAGAVAH